MSTANERPSTPSSAGSSVTTLVVALLALTATLVVAVIGGGLLYVTLPHPSLIEPLSVSVAGVALVITIAGLLITLTTSHRR
ncbi:hypothetical protein J7E99_32330 [Streptomyces sp. ISL-44]|uniref:hypothetical protein n=1 Tax=Streptomyces sp. ISL-44 TaxID=2819184 RepID=UPI001BEAE5A1|nr:hypothetical protein [Streptomyces sp. ISL-44]MBT2545263.1 hypothetical protein [Streptomyces sp. ISL-44]